MIKIKSLFIVPVVAAAILLAACTPAEVTANIESACAAIGAGLSAVAVVSGSIPGGAVISSTISTIITGVGGECSTFATDVGNAVSDITNIGGTANVTVASSGATPAASHRLMARFGTPKPVVHFIVSPAGQVTVLH